MLRMIRKSFLEMMERNILEIKARNGVLGYGVGAFLIKRSVRKDYMLLWILVIRAFPG